MLENGMSDTARFWWAAIIAAIVPVSACALSVLLFKQYGWVLFVCAPTIIGIIATLVYAPRNEQHWGKCFAVSVVSILIIGFSILLLAIDGIICLMMAFPLALPLSLLGVGIGKLITRFVENSKYINFVLLFIILSIPFLLGFEASAKSKPNVHKVVSTVEVNAPIEKVWQTVVAFPQIEKQPEGILRLGFAYPISAETKGEGVGAVRHYNFNTGAFVAPVTEWQAPHLLAFDVTEQPAPMIETSFYKEVHIDHIEYIKTERGQFRLYEKDGKTMLEGTTFYTHDISPDLYWKLFSDEIVNQVHLRVLNHIKEVSEKN